MSGVYLIKVTDAAGKAAYYPVVLRDSRLAPIVVVLPQFSWQAYNDFGGSSLYTADPSNPHILGHFVSFERPYSSNGGASLVFNGRYSPDLLTIRWLERIGYDVTYISDADLADTTYELPASAKVLLFVGHDEYWTWAEFDRVQALRDAHTHLMFMSGNDAYWNIRLKPGNLTGERSGNIICYKTVADPGATPSEHQTIKFRQLNRPENSLIGIMYVRNSRSSGGALVAFDSSLTATGMMFLSQASVRPGDSIPGPVGSEGDEVVNNGQSPVDLQVLFRSPIIPVVSDTGKGPLYYYTTFYVAPSGAGVFASGSNDYAKGLDGVWGATPSPKEQAFTNSVLSWMLSH